MLKNKLLSAMGGVEANYIEDVFSTYLYTGNGSTQTITNGIDLAGKGGMVWVKERNTDTNHVVFDTTRGALQRIQTSSTAAEATFANSITSFLSSGFDLGIGTINTSGNIYASWTFRNAPKFFNHLTVGHTFGTATNVDLSSLGTVGMVVLKRTDSTSNWLVWHKSLFAGNLVYLNLNDVQTADTSISVSGTTLTISSAIATGGYVVYAWAHSTESDSMVQCGVYTGGTLGRSINLGWEPQFVLIKARSGSISRDWYVFDTMRGLTKTGSGSYQLNPNIANKEQAAASDIYPETSGFSLPQTGSSINGSGYTYIYLAIRMPNKPPSSGTEVFQPVVYTGTNADNRLVNTGMKTDMVMARVRSLSSTPGFVVGDRLRGQPYLGTATTNAEISDADALDQQKVGSTEYGTAFSSMSGFWVGNDPTANLNANTTTNNHIVEAFRRAPGFFDIVCDTGTGVTHTVSHNLAATPELMIRKKRSAADNWIVYAGDATDYLILNGTAATADLVTMWNDTAPTSSVFTVGTNDDVNQSAATFVTYLFASLPGISKVGSYTGNGTSQTIDCGFTTGARFVMIKRTDSIGQWCVFDTARGIIAGNDPFLQADFTNPELLGQDAVDADNSGFVVNQTTEALNTSSATYIFLAIA